MTREFNKSLMVLSVFALGFGLMATPPAMAADLGGNCCADLEERIAELEATTARKGNRKVSLEISGHINEAVMFWDDGVESNAYVVTNDNSRSRFRFVGKAKIAGDWTAGYLMEIGVRNVNSKRVNQNDDDAVGDSGLDVRHSYWYIDSKTFGRVSLGHTGSAAEGVTEVNLAHTKDTAKYSDVEDSGLGMLLRQSGTGGLSGLSWRRLIGDSGDQPGEGERREVVKYDTPTWQGFTATAGWGEDDYWDVGLKYAGEFGGFKLAAAVAYGENSDVQSSTIGAERNAFFECMTQVTASSTADCEQLGGSVSVMHTDTGLYVNFAAGQLKDNLISTDANFIGTGADDTSHFWALELGIERKFIDLGKTTFFAQYYNHEGGANDRRRVVAADVLNVSGGDDRIFDTSVEMYGGGVVQSIDNAAMLLYAYYRHYEADLTIMETTAGLDPTSKAQLEALDVVMTGALIKF